MPVIIQGTNKPVSCQLIVLKDNSILLQSDAVHNFSVKSHIRVSLFYRNHLFNFDTEVTGSDKEGIKIKKPRTLFTPAKRILFRTEINESEDAFITIKDKKYRIINISAMGVAFSSENEDFQKNEILRNTGITITNRFNFITDINIRYCKGNIYGARFFKIDNLHWRKVFRYIFKKRYPDFDFFRYSDIEKIIPQYYNSRYVNLDLVDDSGPDIIKIMKRLNRIKDYNLLSTIIQYSKNNKLISLGCSIRIYNRTYMGSEITVVPDTMLIPKEKTDIYLMLSDAMLYNYYCSYFLFYINDDFVWHKELFTFFSQAVNNEKLFFYDELHCLKVNVKKGALKKKSISPYSLHVQYKESAEFVKFSREHLAYLESRAYDYKQRGFSELAQIYNLLNLFIDRCIFHITENGRTVAFIVAEAYPSTLHLKFNLNSCRVYCPDKDVPVESLILCALPEITAFYNKYNIREYNILFKKYSGNNNIIKLNSPWIKYKGVTGRAVMSREGLKLFKEIFLGNFDYYTDYYPLSTSQKMIWLLENYFPGTSISNVSGTLKIFEKVNTLALEKAVNMFLEKNEGMRLRMILENGNIKQYVKPFKYRKLDFIDLSHVKSRDELYEWEKKTTSTPFELYNSDLYYYVILKINENEYWLYAKVHHIIHDAYSMGLFTNDVGSYYHWIAHNNLPAVVPENPSYVDYVLREYNYKYTDFFDEDRDYFRNVFATVPELLSFKKRTRINPDLRSNRKSFIIKGKLLKDIKRFAEYSNISIFSLLIAVLFVYLFRITGKRDIVLGTSIFNRTRKEMRTAGIFTSYIPFRMSVKDNTSFTEFLGFMNKNWTELLYHRRYPFELIQKDFREKHKTHDRLFDISITYQNADFGLEEFPLDYVLKWNPYGHQMESLNIHVSDSIIENKLIVNFDYLVSLFKVKDISDMFKRIKNILTDGINNPHKCVSVLNILAGQERKKILIDFNKTEVMYPDNSVVELFEKQAEKNPEKTALVYNGIKETYYELNSNANRIAHFLLQVNKINKSKYIGVFIKNSIIQVEALLGILKAGFAFIPLDTKNPVSRLKKIINDAKIKIIISEKERLTELESLENKCKKLDHYLVLDYKFPPSMNKKGSGCIKYGVELLKHSSVSNPCISIKPDDICYAIYTSGSTGKPKGVIIRHYSLVNLCHWVIDYFNLDIDDRATRYASFGFDGAVFELFPYLLKGATVFIIEDEQRLDLKLLNSFFNENKISVAFLPPRIAEEFMKLNNRSLRILIVAGEKFNYFKKTNYNIFNNYGPTENTVQATCFFVDSNYKNIPIGKPISNVKAYILDDYLNPLPCGIIGELYLSGKGLAAGYLNNDELTARCFIDNPFIPGERMYKSGDLAEWRKDGNILFHGRKDNQVKMRGFRIETEEIERNIEQLKEVKKALIVPLEKNNQITYLIAFIINTAKLKTEKIKSFLSSRLPNYMIPYKFYFLKKIPVTVNGKTDIKKLLDIHNESEKKRTAEIDIVMPRTELQKKIYKTWQKILGRNDFGIHDDFFKSGGDSIKAIQFVNSYFLHKYNVSVQDLYNYPTIELFSKELTKKNKGSMNNLVYVEDHIKINSDMKKKNIKICGEEYKINNVLITDPEGFISIHILNSLKMLKKCNVYCLVSKKNIYNENKFKKNILEYYFPGKYKSLSEHNIFLVPGDICDMYLSMGKDNYNSLLNKIDTIYHYAPMLNFFGNYKDIEKVNVFGTENIIKFSLLSGAKLNYISTLSVSGRSLVAQTKNNPLFDENSLNIGQKYQDNIYVRSKLEAEKSILNNEKNGLIYSIFRLGNISERYNDGVFQRNIYDNWQHIILKILINLSVIPDTIFHTELDFTPVDYSSEFIIRLSQIKESENRIFHIKNQNTITFKKLFNLFQNYGINVSILKSISYKEFLKYINRIKHENEWELSMLGEEFNYDRIFGEDYQVDIKSEITQKYLSLLNLSWPEIDEAYIKKILDYWKKVGFISGV